MTLSNLGDYIELCTTKNVNDLYGPNDVRGISTQKKFIKSKTDANNLKLTNFNIVEPGCFSFNPNTARMGEKICVSFNDTNETYIVSAIYPVFKIKDENLLNPKFLMIYFNRSEFDRYARYNSWGSARETFSFEDFCNIEMIIPDIKIQNKYVEIYEGMINNLHSFEKGLDNLKLLGDIYIENLRRLLPLQRIGDHLTLVDERNTENLYSNVKSVSITKYFNEVGAKVNKNDLKKYKIVKPNEISYVQTTGNEKCLAFAINDTTENILVTSVNNVFKTDSLLNPYYLGLWFRRKEFDRYARFISWGSARETVSWEDLCEVKIPIPFIEVQNEIVACFMELKDRRRYIEKLRKEIVDACSILIKGAVKEAEGGN